MAIEPDTKDWTWVTSRRCPECGYDGSTVASARIARGLRDATTPWIDLLGGSAVHVRPDASTWSALEFGCHLRDAFGVIDGRLRSMLTDDDPLFANWDQDATAVDDDYRAQDPAAVADQLRAAADRLADRFDTVDANAWARSGQRSDGARFTVLSLGRYALHEPIHHLVDLRR